MDELEYLRKENERLRKALNDRQQVSIASPRSFLEDHEFITDCCRYAEGIFSKQDVKKKYHFDDATWTRLGEDEALIETIELEKVRRVRSGAFKREKAQQHIVKAPDILEKIMSDDSANARHRVDSIKALDALADPGPQATPPADKFIITIDLTADAKLRSAEPDPNDVIVIDATRPAAIPDKTEDDWK